MNVNRATEEEESIVSLNSSPILKLYCRSDKYPASCSKRRGASRPNCQVIIPNIALSDDLHTPIPAQQINNTP